MLGLHLAWCLWFSQKPISSNIWADRAGFLGGHKGGARGRKPPQGAALISMRERRAQIGQAA